MIFLPASISSTYNCAQVLSRITKHFECQLCLEEGNSMIGKTLGNFQTTSQLGKGGMGKVYQAKDQKLGRNVAIKVLPEEFARDADRVAPNR
jgi:serine/threonine protein kinase